jgi:hypothetical protein
LSNSEIYLVKKPASNSSVEMRDTILRDYFGYTDADIEALNNSKNGYLRICNDKSIDWASKDQVKHWKVDKYGQVTIPLPQNWCDEAIRFRGQRVQSETFKLGGFITDSLISNEVVADLNIILSRSGNERMEAVSKLLLTISASGRYSPQIFRALRFLANELGYKNNPYLLLAMAQSNMVTSDVPSVGNPVFDQALINNAIAATNANLNNTSSKSALMRISSTEAAFLNRQASLLYSRAGNDQEARNRDWIDRFLTMSAAERSGFSEGDLVELTSSTASMSVAKPLTQAELSLKQLNDRRRAVVEQEMRNDGIGVPSQQTGNRPEQYFQRADDSVTTEKEEPIVKGKDKRGRPILSGKTQAVQHTLMLYQRANVRANGASAALSLPLSYLNARTTMQRLWDITEYMNQRDQSLQRIGAERCRMVPLKPATINKLILELRRSGRASISHPYRDSVKLTIRQLEADKEESNAFWNSIRN